MCRRRRTYWKFYNSKDNGVANGRMSLTLCRHDTKLSFLKHPLDNKSKDERSPKKARLSEQADNKLSIASKLSTGAYSNLSDMRKDAELVSESMASSVRAEAKERENSRLQIDDLKQLQRIQAFQLVVKDVVDQESRYEAVHGNKAIKQEDGAIANGHPSSKGDGGPAGAGTVLTLFGNAPTPKQLFSSMQRPSAEAIERNIKTELPVEEMSLPTGLAATKIMPIPADSKKKGPTFEEAFAPPHSLPLLQPPKSHKRSTTRDNTTITWEFKDQLSRNKKGGYTTQSLSVGDWLGYGGTESKDEPTSPREKRKQRDRALSGGESSQPPPRRESFTNTPAKEEEALFRRAYSSFAPSYDNSKAIVPQEVKSMVWWNKIGQQRYNETFAIDPALSDEQPTKFADVLSGMEEVKLREEDFGQIVEELHELEEDDNLGIVREKTNVDQVLREISELLETLTSHQRIRNASLGASTALTRTPISPAPALASRIGRPDSPAEDEMSTYYSLRRELAYLMLRLPPYAVAKLDGEQLAELGVSSLIPFQSKDVKGAMEEDQVARLAKYTAMATAAGIASLTRPGSQSGQHYNSTNQRTPAIGQAANTRYGQSALYGASRTPMQPQFQRSTSNQSTYGTPSATAPRPGYGQQPNQYSRPQNYSQSNGQQQYYRPQQTSGNYAGYSQLYGASTPQTQQRPSFSSSQPLAQYQQRAANAASYQTNTQQPQSPFTQRTASPLKPAPPVNYPSQPSPGPTQQRPQYPLQQAQPGSGRSTPANNYPSQPQTPVNGYGQRPVAPAPRTGSGTPQPPNIQPAPPTGQQQATAQTNGHA